MNKNLARQITFRVTEESYQCVVNDAQNCNMSVADYARCQIEKRPFFSVDKSKEMLQILTRFSTVLNRERTLHNERNIKSLEEGCINLWQLLNQ